MQVSIIMINYNTYELTKNSILSIIEKTTGIEYEIILIDNNSPDNSGIKLKDFFPEIKVYCMESNLGTSKAFNFGWRKATGKYILWLNPDIIFQNNYIKVLMDFMESNLQCGVCGGNLVGKDLLPTHSFRKKIPSLKTYKRDFSFTHKFLKFVLKKKYDCEYNYNNKPLEVGYVTGAGMLTRKSYLEELNGFDEDIFMYSEEVEFQFRIINKLGKKIYSVPDAKMIHLEGGSFIKERKFNENRFLLGIQGTSVYMEKSYGFNSDKLYLKLLIKSYKKFSIVFRFISKKLYYEYTKKKAIVEEYCKKMES